MKKTNNLCINELLSEPAVLHSQILTRVAAPPPPGNNIYDTLPIETRPGYDRNDMKRHSVSKYELQYVLINFGLFFKVGG